MYQTISSHLAKYSVYVRFLKLQCDKQDITDAVTGTIDTTSTAATTNPGVPLCTFVLFGTTSFIAEIVNFADMLHN